MKKSVCDLASSPGPSLRGRGLGTTLVCDGGHAFVLKHKVSIDATRKSKRIVMICKRASESPINACQGESYYTLHVDLSNQILSYITVVAYLLSSSQICTHVALREWMIARDTTVGAFHL